MTLLTIDEVAAIGRVSRRTIWREIARGRLAVVRITEGRVRVREDEALRWAGLSSQYPPSTASTMMDDDKHD
jgi:excisionase family DNA binding protein